MADGRPRRFSKYQDGVSVKYFLVSLTDEKFSGINQRIDYIEKMIAAAKENVDEKMTGFPGTYMRIGALEPDINTLKGEIKALSKSYDQMEGKASQRSLIITLVIAIVSLLIAGVVGVASLLRHFQY